MTEEEKTNQINITKTILRQIFSFNENLFEELKVKGVSPMCEGKHQRGGAIIHLPNNEKVEVRLTWLDLYDVKYYSDVKSDMIVQDGGEINYEASGKCLYQLDGCYFDMLADVIEKAVKENPPTPKKDFNTLDIFKDFNERFSLN